MWWRSDKTGKAVAGHDSNEAPPARLSVRVRRWALFGPLLVLIAVAPWFVPWRFASSAPGSDPSAVINQAIAEANGKSATAAPAPTDANVRDVTKAIAAFGVGGYDAPVSSKALAAVSTRPGHYQTLGSIRIPAIGLDVKYGEGVSAESLEKGPGHWPGTPLPGRDGNAVISGHRNTHTQPFKYLNLLHPGDKIITQLGNRPPVTYKVTKTTIVPQAKYEDFVLRQPTDELARQITLFACHPEGNPIYRIVVQGEADAL